jgi:ABC-2 type transport system permease protein
LRRARGLGRLVAVRDLFGAAIAQQVVGLGFAALFGGVMVGEYFAFRRGFAALADMRLAGAGLTLYLLEGLLVLILLIALVSFVTSGLWIFYRAGDTRLLLAAPLPVAGLYALRALETFVLTSWALVVVGVPALLALGVTYDRSAVFYLRAALILAAFAGFTGALGALSTTVAGAVLRRAPTRLAVGVTVVLLVAVFALVVGKQIVPSTADFYTLFEPGLPNGKPLSIRFIEARFAWWPSHPFAAALYTDGTGGAAGSAGTRLAVWLLPVGLFVLAATLGRRLYATALPVIAESFVMGAAEGPPRTGAATFPRWLRGPIGALLERDLLGIARNPHEWGRAAFLGFLLVLYTSFIFVAPLREVANRPEAVARLLLLNVVAAGYFLTAFGLRFAFPSMSLEGRAAWVLFSSPVSLLRLVFAKAALFSALLGLAVVPIALAGTLRLVRDPVLALLTVTLLVLVVVTTATLLLAFGTAWPNFRESNPEALSTSGGGLAATLCCLAYVALMGWLGQQAALARAAGDAGLPWLAAAAAVSLGLTGGSLLLAARSVRTLEVV